MGFCDAAVIQNQCIIHVSEQLSSELTLILDTELSSNHICVLVLGVGPRELAGVAIPEGPGLGLAGDKLIQVECRKLLQRRCIN